MEQANTQVVILDSSNYEDIFICGFCRMVFNSLQVFLEHKKCHSARQHTFANIILDSGNQILETIISGAHQDRAELAQPKQQQMNEEEASSAGEPIQPSNNEKEATSADEQVQPEYYKEEATSAGEPVQPEINEEDATSAGEPIQSEINEEEATSADVPIQPEINEEEATSAGKRVQPDYYKEKATSADKPIQPRINEEEDTSAGKPIKPEINKEDAISAGKPIQPQINEEAASAGDSNLGEYKCTLCEKSFKRPKCLYAHWKLHTEPSQCQICGRCFQDVFHLKRHYLTHKVWPDGLNETTPKSIPIDWHYYRCSYCEAVLANYTLFKAHLNTHLDLKKFKCIQGDCTQFFDTIEEILHHNISEVHRTMKYTCHICKDTFVSLIEIAEHQESHNYCKEQSKVEKIQYKCPQCDATFKQVETLSLHELTESHNKPCVYCKKCFASDKRLRMHLQIHKINKCFQCEICTKSFKMKKYLTSHMLKHGDRSFVCKVCKESFKRQDLLLRHMKTHSKNMRCKCPFKDVCSCTKEFYRSDKLKQHLKAHAHLFSTPPSKKVKPTEVTCTTVSKKSVETGTMEICIVPFNNQVEKTGES